MIESKAAPLGLGLRIFCALVPGMAALIIAAYNFTKGREQAGAVAVTWTLFGFLGYFVIGLLLSI